MGDLASTSTKYREPQPLVLKDHKTEEDYTISSAKGMDPSRDDLAKSNQTVISALKSFEFYLKRSQQSNEGDFRTIIQRIESLEIFENQISKTLEAQKNLHNIMMDTLKCDLKILTHEVKSLHQTSRRIPGLDALTDSVNKVIEVMGNFEMVNVKLDTLMDQVKEASDTAKARGTRSNLELTSGQQTPGIWTWIWGFFSNSRGPWQMNPAPPSPVVVTRSQGTDPRSRASRRVHQHKRANPMSQAATDF